MLKRLSITTFAGLKTFPVYISVWGGRGAVGDVESVGNPPAAACGKRVTCVKQKNIYPTYFPLNPKEESHGRACASDRLCRVCLRYVNLFQRCLLVFIARAQRWYPLLSQSVSSSSFAVQVVSLHIFVDFLHFVFFCHLIQLEHFLGRPSTLLLLVVRRC